MVKGSNSTEFQKDAERFVAFRSHIEKQLHIDTDHARFNMKRISYQIVAYAWSSPY